MRMARTSPFPEILMAIWCRGLIMTVSKMKWLRRICCIQNQVSKCSIASTRQKQIKGTDKWMKNSPVQWPMCKNWITLWSLPAHKIITISTTHCSVLIGSLARELSISKHHQYTMNQKISLCLVAISEFQHSRACLQTWLHKNSTSMSKSSKP